MGTQKNTTFLLVIDEMIYIVKGPISKKFGGLKNHALDNCLDCESFGQVVFDVLIAFSNVNYG